MAIKILDPIATDYGVSPTNLILSCQGVMSVCKIMVNDELKYRVSANTVFRASSGAQPLKFGSVNVNVDPSELTSNLFEKLYDALKLEYPNYENV